LCEGSRGLANRYFEGSTEEGRSWELQVVTEASSGRGGGWGGSSGDPEEKKTAVRKHDGTGGEIQLKKERLILILTLRKTTDHKDGGKEIENRVKQEGETKTSSRSPEKAARDSQVTSHKCTDFWEEEGRKGLEEEVRCFYVEELSWRQKVLTRRCLFLNIKRDGSRGNKPGYWGRNSIFGRKGGATTDD